jgi:4a-hydroxytetrahydrobiopterin dehydratase
MQPHFSQGADTEPTRKKLTTLISSPGGRWALTSSGKGIERTFKFKTFTKTWVCSSDFASITRGWTQVQ